MCRKALNVLPSVRKRRSWNRIRLQAECFEPMLEYLAQARCPHSVDQQANLIDRPKLTRKERRNSSLGTERVPRAQKKPLVLNPHHAQLEG